MLRTTLFATAVVFAAVLSAPAAEPDLSGTWLLSFAARFEAGYSNVCILKIESKGGKPTASIVAVPGEGSAPTIKSFGVVGKEVTVALPTGVSFVGLIGDNPKQILGTFGNESTQLRARLVRTDKDSIDAPFTRGKAPEEATKAQQLAIRPKMLQSQAKREKDAEKKKEILAKVEEAQKEADEKVPGLYRKVVEDHADHPAAIDASLVILQSAGKWKVAPDEARKLVALIEKQAAPYGPKYASFTVVAAAEGLLAQKGLEAVAADTLRPVVKGLTGQEPVAFQVKVLTAYKSALDGTKEAGEAKAIGGRLAKLDDQLDKEYLASVPPFKPAAFAGRKGAGANRVAVMELFTGAECPPCVAADVAFDALAKSYKPTDLVLIQYHMHIPGPDPMTNPDTEARWDYYLEKFPEGVRGTPTTLFNGKPQAGGGGGMNNAESKFKQYREIIDPLLEETVPTKVSGKATRRGDKIDIAVEVGAAPGEGDWKLRVLVVEETVKYVGGNRLRFHHHVVRAMPGGPAGVAIKNGSLSHTATADLAAIRKGLAKYLDDHAANERPFPSAARPLDLKHLKVIALVQDDKTREIAQAVQIAIAE